MDKKYCFIISAMRSGSTLLKALIATRPDCSDFPETPFADYNIVESDKRIIVLKKPPGFENIEYPELPAIEAKKIILIRNPHDTVRSLKQVFISRNKTDSVFNDKEFLISYWYMVYSNIIKKKIMEDGNSMVVRYEDLITNPKEETSRVFKFIGTDFPEGTDTYSVPNNYNWEWRKDDGGDVIKTLQVQKSNKEGLIDKELVAFIQSDKDIQFVLNYFGYYSNSIPECVI